MEPLDTRAARPVALVTGASRLAGIGAAVATRLAADGFDVAITYWTAYDERMPWRSRTADHDELEGRLGKLGAQTAAVEADLSDVAASATVFDHVEAELGPVTALVLCHCESVNSDLLGTTVDSFDRHFVVNARASWLLIREYALRFSGMPGSGRIVALTSDATAGNLPYGASKGALDRIVIAAASELAGRGISANVVNPGATDTGWMSDQQLQATAEALPLRRVGIPDDAANLVSWLCSAQGGWVNGQLLHSDGGASA